MHKIIFSIIILMIFSCTNSEVNKSSNLDKSKNWTITNFVKADSINPILQPSTELSFQCPLNQIEIKWEERNVFNPSAIVKDDKVYLLYRAQDKTGTSRIGMAISSDGLNFKKEAHPVFYPDNDEMTQYEWHHKKQSFRKYFGNCENCFDGVEDPRIIEDENGRYIMTYTSYDGKTARLCLASSKNLTKWTKHGLVLKDDKFKNLWSKAGAIVVEVIEGKNIAKKIDGKYWMYFGDTNIFLAKSDDLIHWEACTNNESQKIISVLHPRMGHFDSRLVEPGPYAIYKDEGILLIYNASNAANFNDPNLPKYTYAAGQALFDKDKPYKLLDRTNGYFIYPDKEYEKVGEVNEVCFVEGLVNFKDKWFLYYGTADSKIAVAVSEHN